MHLVLAVIGLATIVSSADAGVIGDKLGQQIEATSVHDSIPVIIYFSKSKDLSPHKKRLRDFFYRTNSNRRNQNQPTLSARRELRRQLRSAYIRALKSDASASQKTVKAVLNSMRRPVKRDLWMLNALAIDLPAGSVATIASLPGVDRIELDQEIHLTDLPPSGGAVPTWNLDRVRAPEVWQLGITGAGATVSSMDTGVDATHPDLAANWRGGANSWFDPYGVYAQPHDSDGHGTQTTGVMVGGSASGTAVGVAPDAQWIAAKIFRDNMTASYSAIHAAFQWNLDPDNNPTTDDAPDVINNSWGIPYNSIPDVCDTEFHADIDALVAAGITVIFAAGNDGPADNTLLSPADYDAVLTVGAMDAFYNVPSFSSRGPSNCSTSGLFPQLSAPGVDIYTTDLSFGLGLALDPYVSGVQGTSYAAPHVAGIVALLKSDQPDMSVDDTRSSLLATAIDYGVLGPDTSFGYGLVDAYGALLKARCPAGIQDSDSDGWLDACDNCTLTANPDQTDTNNDGYGNVCDADLNGDGVITNLDILVFLGHINTQNLESDLNVDGHVTNLDILAFLALLTSNNGMPGPSGLVE